MSDGMGYPSTRASEGEAAKKKKKAKAKRPARAPQKERDDNTDVAYLIVAVAAMIAGVRLWQTKVKPWLNATFSDLTSGRDGHLFGSVTVVDAAGFAIIGVPALVAALLWMRRKRKTA